MPKKSWRILDFHIHFAVRSNRRTERASGAPDSELTYGQRQYRWMMEAWDFPTPEPEVPEPPVVLERWLGEIKRYNLEGVVFVTGAGSEFMAAAQANNPGRIFSFSHISPDDPDALQKITHDIEDLKLSGFKMFGPQLERPFDDPAYWPIWELLAKHRVPLLIHFGVLGGGGGIVYHPRMSPLTVDPVARAFPEIPIVIPHFGAGYWGDLLQLGWAHENVHVDTSGSNQWIRWMPYPLTLESLLQKAYETFGPDRIIFGSDSSYFPRGFAVRYVQDLIRAARYNGMPDADLQKILYDNAWRILHPGGVANHES
ncbi:amidohydrolase family protein [Sulfobacillus harzensis]|uniref:Amidohydrolase n=1 Tax=Sulfobacillus harzensis TaxID=2729629 RepID=A0A7Y0L6N9_9FIRM|nr:amidohydrolase family protein [Sulfobacillus harzensis]NMP22914.1 amidohydrolase [Sulfobacillus harzensis]